MASVTDRIARAVAANVKALAAEEAAIRDPNNVEAEIKALQAREDATERTENARLLARQPEKLQYSQKPSGESQLGMEEADLNKLDRRLGRLHAKLRLGIETDHEAQIFGQGINFFHIENWYSVHSVIRTTLKFMGLYRRGRRNADQIQVR